MKFNFRRFGIGALLSLSLLWVGCDRKTEVRPASSSMEQIPAEQVFRDNRGYRVYYTDSNQEVVENFFSTETPPYLRDRMNIRVITPETNNFRGNITYANSVRVFRDLDEGKKGYAKTLRFTLPEYPRPEYKHTEIHLSKGKGLLPGNEFYDNGKFAPTLSNMKEIK